MNECRYIQRCVSVDYYLAPPLAHLDPPCSPLTGVLPYKVPVLRLYGATQLGQKACLHVHSVFPYLYIPSFSVERLQLCQELEGALARSYGATQGQYIHDIREEKGIPFYGYHEREVTFLKVLFYQPRFVTRCAEILLKGCIRGAPVQPFESHFPYTLQFMTDYNIHGMNMINLSKVWFRTSTPSPSTTTPDYISHKILAIATSDLLDPELAPKTCCSELEADCRGQDVLNVLFIDIKSNPGLKAICDEERDRRHNAGHFTPTQLHKSLIRNAETHSQTIKWEMKLGSIISHLTQLQASFSNSAVQMNSQIDSSPMFDDDVVDFLDVLGKSYSQHTFSQPSQPSQPAIQSQPSVPLLSSQTDRKSPVFKAKYDEESDEDDDVNVSIMMTQKIFYPTIEDTEQYSICHENPADKSFQSAQKSPVISSNPTSSTSLISQAIIPSYEQVVNSDSDDSLSCDISDSQLAAALDCDEVEMLQLDGNSEVPVVRKSKRLGGRVPLSSMIGRQRSDDKRESVSLVIGETTRLSAERKRAREKCVEPIEKVDETVLESRCKSKSCEQALTKCPTVPDDKKETSIAGFRVAVGRTGASLRRVNGVKLESVSKETNVKVKKILEVGTGKKVTPGPSHQAANHLVCKGSPPQCTPSLSTANSPSSKFDLNHFKELQESPSRKVKRKRQIRSLSLKRRAKKEKVLQNSQSSADVETPGKPRALFKEDGPSNKLKASQGARRITMSQFLAAVKEHTIESCDEIVESLDMKTTEDFIDTIKSSSSQSDTTDVIKSDSSGLPAVELSASINSVTSEDNTQSSQEAETVEDIGTEEEENDKGSIDKKRYTPDQASCSKYDHVMMWLSESSQDEGEDNQHKTPSQTVQASLRSDSLQLFSPEEVSEGSQILSSPHILPSSPLIDLPLIDLRLIDLPPSPLPCNESTPHVKRFRKASTLSDSTTKTFFSSPQVLSSPQMFSSPQILSSPEFLSSSYSSSTPGIEFMSSFFVSQTETDHHEPPVLQSLKYCITPPSLSSVMEQDYEEEASVMPFYSLEGEVSKPEAFQHEKDSVEGVHEYCKSELVLTELKYAIRPPTLQDVRKWLADKSEKNIVAQVKTTKPSPKPLPASKTPFKPRPSSNPSKLNSCSTPLSSHSLHTPLSKFSKKNIFSPGSPLSPTLAQNSHLFPSNTSFTSAPVPDNTKSHAVQHLTVLSIECFASGVGDQLPNPKYDPLLSLFYSVYDDSKEGIDHGIICTRPTFSPFRETEKITVVESEGELFEEFFAILDCYDPDIITGYEITKTSLGYVIERGNVIGLNLQGRLSRFPELEVKEKEEGARSSWWVKASNELTITGRVIIGLWRLMRTELTLTNYSFENIVHHVLKERIPCYTNKTLLSLYSSSLSFHSFIEYYTLRSQVNIRLLLDLNIIIRTSEQGRLYGIDFYSVLSRGSQFRVESMMTRLAKPRGFISISPSPEQRMAMAAPELIPLVMEPESCFYSDPVVVLDFQSLYPTMIIAYNMCFSTCLGRVNSLGTGETFPLGTTMHTVPPELLLKYKNNIFVSPNGVAFVDKTVRLGVLPMMLSEILQTRIMVKEMMKQFKNDKSLHKMLDAKQMALKLIANVTYGYTSANFSGRMPCIEIGDSIVAKGRETLEAAIDLVNETAEWGGRVVYGDTDSLFIVFKGCSKAEAFRRGREIAKLVSERNPDPVKLKFEKVYMPCILQTKKRYVGMKFEREDEVKGEYEAKGIETVRRDGCPIGVKILKQALLTLFSSKDLSLVKEFVQHQFTKMIHGKVSLQDYIFAKEFRGMDGYKPGVCVPALEIARRRIKKDGRNDPLVSERVQYVVCYGSPGLPLIQLIHEPAELFTDTSLKLNTIYYITKAVLPVLQRALGLVGVNVTAWYHQLPLHLRTHTAPRSATSHRTISHYYSTKHCTICDKVSEGLCSCYSNPQKVAVVITQRLNILENQLSAMRIICKDCSGLREEGLSCTSVMCPVLYKKVALTRDHDVSVKLRDQVDNLYDW